MSTGARNCSGTRDPGEQNTGADTSEEGENKISKRYVKECYGEKWRRETGTSLRRQHMDKGLKDAREPHGDERKAFLVAGRARARALRQARTKDPWDTEEAHVPGAERVS